jgi:hypothetical protein
LYPISSSAPTTVLSKGCYLCFGITEANAF